ncbi:hypothetical protein [Lactobacillus crispatus]|jgi:hypothetical protein|nr:hypothetical protein [Lactobacillus crispatus]
MKKLNEKELVEVKGGFVDGLVNPNVSFLCVTNFTSKHRPNLIKWMFHLK